MIILLIRTFSLLIKHGRIIFPDLNNVIADIEDCESEITELEILNKHVSDILECRIEATLNEMERTPLCEVPEHDTMTPKEFLKLTESTCAKAFETLKNQSLKVEASVDELINTLKSQVRGAKLLFYFLKNNKTPADQQDIFRPNCSSNDIFLRLKSSHCTMKTHRGLMKTGLPLFE